MRTWARVAAMPQRYSILCAQMISTLCDVVGDLIDIGSLRRGICWPQQHSNVMQKILRKARKGTHVILYPGKSR